MKEIKGWMRPHELDRRGGREPFDPVVEGSRYGLPRELSLAIWERVCAETIDRTGQPDLEQAKRRFHAVATRIAARGGRWPHADIGKQTRVEAEQGGGSVRGAGVDGLSTLAPGRRTLVEAEASRWEPAAAAAIDAVSEAAVETAIEESREGVGVDPPSARTRDVAAASGAHRLPIPMLDRMEQAFGRRFDDVEIHVDSAEVPAGIEAFTRGHHIFFGRGAFVPDSDHGEHVIAHELAHVAQQSAPTAGGGVATRAALEADAHQAALAALAGRAASVSLFAPGAAALAFSDGKVPQSPSTGSSSGSSSRSTPGAPAPSSARAATSGGTVIPRFSPAASPVAPARSAAATPASVPVSAAPRRGQTADGLHVPEAPSSLTPDAAGRLHTAQAGNQGNAAATTTLPSGQQQTDVGRAAVEEPQAEQDARAQQGVVTDVDDRPPPSPEIEQACARIRQVIRDKRPPSEDKLVDAKPREMAQEAGSQMSGDVEQRAGTVRQGYADMQQPPPGSPSSTPVPPTIPPAGAQTQPVDGGAGTPDPLQPDDVSLDADVADQKKQIDNAGMNTDPAKLVKDGPIGDAHGGVDDLQNVAKTDPQKVIADQAAAITKAKGDMHALQQAADKALADARAGTVDQMAKHTTGVKGSEEQQRAQAGEKMKGIFDRTQKAVDTLLQPLSGDAVARWDAGVAQLSTDFEASLADVKRRIDERHSGIGGAFTGAWDWATGLPDWVTEGYDRAEAKFGDGATSLITDISRDVNKVIEDCKQLIQQARKDIDAVVKSLPASLQTWAQGEAAKLDQQLDALDKRVDQTQKGINKDLINRADSAVQQVREQVADLREKAKGAIAKVAAALVEFAKNPAKAIVNGLLSALGIPPDQFWSLVGQLGDVIGAIAKDPVKFGKGLISGAGQGFKQFFEHFPQHLKEIVLNWVFDQLGATGVPIPSDFSGPSIMSTVLAIVGIDTPLVTAMLGGEISDPDEAAEAHKELAGVLSGDPKALVALLREEFDPASLLPMIRDAAISFLIQTLITQAAERIAALLVPGGAILQAVEAIFKVLQWVINNAARIFTLIQALVSTAAQAVAGNIAGVAAGVENSLVQIIVVAIDFLAGYLGLGGLGGKLKGVIMKLGGKLKALLQKVIGAVAKRAKARAKTKHHEKHAHEPHSPDKHEDNRDPQKVKDDAKDPRNHQHDPDDKDPRSHHGAEDDNDPRNHHKAEDDQAPKKQHHHDEDDKDPKKHHHDEDDKDPKKHKDEDEDDKKKHEHDQAEAKRAAREAANLGWAAARSATEREVLPKAALKAVLARAEHTTPKAKVSLEAKDRETAWTVEAEAKVGDARATDTDGSGWIAYAETSRSKWYAAKSEERLHSDIIKDAAQALQRTDQQYGTEPYNAKEQYDAISKEVREQKRTGRNRITLRGIELRIDLESYQSAERDNKATVEIAIAPNSQFEKFQLELTAGNKYHATAASGSAKATSSYDIRGPWSKIQQFHPLYPNFTAQKAHPANTFNGMSGCKFPTGDYHLKSRRNVSGLGTAAKDWRAYLFGEMRKSASYYMTQGLPQDKAEDVAQKALVARYRGLDYVIDNWEELSLTTTAHDFDGHHVNPTVWGGPDIKTNIYILRKDDHKPYSRYFETAQAAVINEAYP